MRYKAALDDALTEAIQKLEQANPLNLDLARLKALKTDVVISGNHNDLPHLKEYTDSGRHARSIKSFKLPFDGNDEGVSGEIGIVIFNNMMLTGFDAPIEQVMYLDKVIVAHNLLQAIARVNRVGARRRKRASSSTTSASTTTSSRPSTTTTSASRRKCSTR